MERLSIEKTKSTPEVLFDPETCELRIEGQSYPENAFKFYEPVLAWLDDFLRQLDREVVLEFYFNMPYINTRSSKCVMMLLEKLENAYVGGKGVAVRWYYDTDNETALECAEEFKEDLTLPFEISAIEAEK
jgi:hypothetical protein